MAKPEFDISPERRASMSHYLYRQLFLSAPRLSPKDADLTGKTAIVTGANGGLGLEVARSILTLGGNVIIAVRDKAKGETARQSLLKSAAESLNPDAIQVWDLDLASYDSILSFAERTKSLPHLDIAVLNAGVFKRYETFHPSTGYETSMQINFLSNALLMLLLLPIIKAKRTGPGPGHISLVTSEVAAWVKADQLRSSTRILPEFKKKWDFGSLGFQEYYGTSKLLGLLFVSELARHVSPDEVVVNCPNPGFCSSDIAREVSGPLRVVMKAQVAVLARSCEVGARTLVHAVAVLGRESHGQYVEDGKVQP
jgi:NAD(P)-dependent dehydrogenase (short-subunit alcohol dehydrogenase family)